MARPIFSAKSGYSSKGSALFAPTSIGSCPALRTASNTVCLSGKPAWSNPTTTFISPHSLEPVFADQESNASDEQKGSYNEIDHTRCRIAQQHVEQSSGTGSNPPIEEYSKHG